MVELLLVEVLIVVEIADVVVVLDERDVVLVVEAGLFRSRSRQGHGALCGRNGTHSMTVTSSKLVSVTVSTPTTPESRRAVTVS